MMHDQSLGTCQIQPWCNKSHQTGLLLVFSIHSRNCHNIPKTELSIQQLLFPATSLSQQKPKDFRA
jgi:hypothetical protein